MAKKAIRPSSNLNPRKTSGRTAENPLDKLFRLAEKSTLENLVLDIASGDSSLYRRSLDYLRNAIKLTAEDSAAAEVDSLMALWDELEGDLEEINDLGGGDDDTVDHVDELLFDLAEKLKKAKIPRDDRRLFLEKALPYIQGGNAGMDDQLYALAYAACRDAEDHRHFARRLEDVGSHWALVNAMRIYRELNDREKYLDLRLRDLNYGNDYYDLADFYWKQGEREKALETARDGLAKGQDSLTELRRFLADRAKAAGDRRGFLDLQFQETVDGLTSEGYRRFRGLCNDEEWTRYEPKLMEKLPKAWASEQVKIRLLRGEDALAAEIISRQRLERYSGFEFLSHAKRLEKTQPEKILKFYLSGVGSLRHPLPRKEYARIANALGMIRGVMLDVLNDADRWNRYKAEILHKTERRPTFHEEAAERIADWKPEWMCRSPNREKPKTFARAVPHDRGSRP